MCLPFFTGCAMINMLTRKQSGLMESGLMFFGMTTRLCLLALSR